MSQAKQKDHCDICRQIREGCEADELNPEQCTVCQRKGYFLDPRNGRLVVCESCSRGFRLKLWLAHEEADGHWVPKFEAA